MGGLLCLIIVQFVQFFTLATSAWCVVALMRRPQVHAPTDSIDSVDDIYWRLRVEVGKGGKAGRGLGVEFGVGFGAHTYQRSPLVMMAHHPATLQVHFAVRVLCASLQVCLPLLPFLRTDFCGPHAPMQVVPPEEEGLEVIGVPPIPAASTNNLAAMDTAQQDRLLHCYHFYQVGRPCTHAGPCTHASMHPCTHTSIHPGYCLGETLPHALGHCHNSS